MGKAWIVAGFVSALVLGSVPAQAQGVGPYIKVPHPSGDVYIPLGGPLAPAAPTALWPAPETPAAPGTPATPAVPAAPAVPVPAAERPSATGFYVIDRRSETRPAPPAPRGGGFSVIDKP